MPECSESAHPTVAQRPACVDGTSPPPGGAPDPASAPRLRGRSRRRVHAGIVAIVVTAGALVSSLATGTWHAPDTRGAAARGAAARSAQTAPRAPASAVPASVAAARAIAAELARRGRLGADVRFEPTDLGQPNALASFDASRARCVVRLDPRLDADTASLAFRFLVYHELSHCELFARPGLFSAWPGLDADAARVLDDLLVLDLIDPPEDRSLYHWHDVAHETYADLRALAMLREDGVAKAELSALAARRDQAPFDFGHQTAEALRDLIAESGAPPAGRPDPGLERDVRRRAARALAERELRLVLPVGAPAGPALDALIASKMRGALQRRARGERPASLELVFESGASGLDRADGSPTLGWFARTAGARAAPSAHDADAIERDLDAWLADAYGPPERRRAAARRAGRLLQRVVAQADVRHAGRGPVVAIAQR